MQSQYIIEDLIKSNQIIISKSVDIQAIIDEIQYEAFNEGYMEGYEAAEREVTNG